MQADSCAGDGTTHVQNVRWSAAASGSNSESAGIVTTPGSECSHQFDAKSGVTSVGNTTTGSVDTCFELAGCWARPYGLNVLPIIPRNPFILIIPVEIWNSTN